LQLVFFFHTFWVAGQFVAFFYDGYTFILINNSIKKCVIINIWIYKIKFQFVFVCFLTIIIINLFQFYYLLSNIFIFQICCCFFYLFAFVDFFQIFFIFVCACKVEFQTYTIHNLVFFVFALTENIIKYAFFSKLIK